MITLRNQQKKRRISNVAHSSEQWTEIDVDKFWNSLHSEWSARTKVHGENVYSISIYKSIYFTKGFQTLVTLSPSQGVYVICVKSVERTENYTWPLSCVIFISRSIHSLIASKFVSMVLMRMMRIHPSSCCPDA